MHHNQNLKPINSTNGPLFLNEWLGLLILNTTPHTMQQWPVYISSSRLASHVWLLVAVAYGQSISNGAALFQKACIGCHDMGGNLLQPVSVLISFRFHNVTSLVVPHLPHSLALLLLSGCHSIHERSAKVSQPLLFRIFFLHTEVRGLLVLCRNGVATEEGIYDITYYGKGRMPASSLLLPLCYYCLQPKHQ